jgi:hypothetical protein
MALALAYEEGFVWMVMVSGDHGKRRVVAGSGKDSLELPTSNALSPSEQHDAISDDVPCLTKQVLGRPPTRLTARYSSKFKLPSFCP